MPAAHEPATLGAEAAPWTWVRALGLAALCFTLATLGRALLPALSDPAGPFLNDWVVFQRAAQRASEGARAEVYERALREGYPFAYPPVALALLAPLGGLAPGHFFALVSLASLAAMAAGLALFARALGGGPRAAREGAWLAAAGSSCAAVTLATGQLAAFHLLAAALGGALWLRGRRFAGGLALALLALKPPLAGGVALLLIARRDGRALAGFAAGLALLAGASLAVGREACEAWLEALSAMRTLLAEQSVQVEKNVTLRAFVELAFDGQSERARTAVWLAAATLLSIAAAIAWWRAPRSGRAFGQAWLFTAATSPYLFLYDGLLLALAFQSFATGRESYSSVRIRRALGACWAGLYVELFVAYVAPIGPPRAGLWIAALLALELADTLRGSSRAAGAGATLSAP